MDIIGMKQPQKGDRCLVCGAKPYVIGVFIPDNPVEWGATAGKTRLVRYCLCAKCQRKPDIQDRAEKIILSELSGGQAVHYGE